MAAAATLQQSRCLSAVIQHNISSKNADMLEACFVPIISNRLLVVVVFLHMYRN
jgi:hypothetical protein